MAWDEFTDCVGSRLEVTGGFIRQELTNVAEETIKDFLSWWNTLSTTNQTLILAIATNVGIPVIKKILEKALGGPVGQAIALALATLAASFSLGAVITSMGLCADQLLI